MSFHVEPVIWETFPGMQLVVAVAGGVDNRRPRPAVGVALQEAAERLRHGWTHPNPQSHPHVKAWRDAFGRPLQNNPSAIMMSLSID